MKGSYATSRHTFEDNIKNNLNKIGWECLDHTNLTEDNEEWWTFANTIMKL
jgi:hypothetical protein